MMTIDKLALLVQNQFLEIKAEFASIRAEMATKRDLADLREEMIARFVTRRELQICMDRLETKLLEEISKIKYAKEIDDLRTRTERIEYELGIGPGPAAA